MIVSGVMTRLAVTLRYVSLSRKTMSRVMRKGPAFLLRMIVATLLRGISNGISSGLDPLDREWLAGVVHLHQVIDAELVDLRCRELSRREGEGEVARICEASLVSHVEGCRACQCADRVGCFLSVADHVDQDRELPWRNVRIGLEPVHHPITSIEPEEDLVARGRDTAEIPLDLEAHPPRHVVDLP